MGHEGGKDLIGQIDGIAVFLENIVVHEDIIDIMRLVFRKRKKILLV